METVCRKKGTGTRTREKSMTNGGSSPVIICRNCHHPVTDPEHGITMEGQFLHTFANPHGHVFEISCFSLAPGCISASVPSMVFSWFQGYAWEIGICAGCARHLGWIFTAPAHRFFGLIPDRLVFP